jgi:hypothetical protein
LSPTVFKWYSNTLQRKLEGLGNLKTGEQVICTVKYANDLVLLAMEETVMLGTIDTMNEIRRC